MSKQEILVIVPCYNESGSFEALVVAFNKVREQLQKDYSLDLLLVNDGSEDNTQELIENFANKYKYIQFRQLAGNVGHQSALRAGLDAAKGYNAVIMMDGDLQHPPVCIPEMLKKWQQTGANVVQMVRNDSHKDVGWAKYLTSRFYYRMLSYLSGLKMEYGSSDFRLIDASVVKTVAASPERNLFLRGYFYWLPVKRVSLQYVPEKRFAGESKYTLKKMLILARQGVLQFSEKPLKIAINLGLLIAFLSFIYGLYLIVSFYLGDRVVSGWTSLMVAMLFCFGVNFVLVGFIGRYLAHSLSLQKRRPEYMIEGEKISSRL